MNDRHSDEDSLERYGNTIAFEERELVRQPPCSWFFVFAGYMNNHPRAPVGMTTVNDERCHVYVQRSRIIPRSHTTRFLVSGACCKLNRSDVAVDFFVDVF